MDPNITFSSKAELIAYVNSNIKANEDGLITEQIMNNILNGVVNLTPEDVIQTSNGTVSQIADATTVFVVDPASVLASFGAVLPANGSEGQIVTIIFGGQITNGNKVITNYTGTTAAIGVSFDPIDAAGTEIYSGETMTYKVIKNIWKRIN